MGIWSWDIIGCDATLELAMDLLTCAGLGPKNYAERRLTFTLVICQPISADGTPLGMWCGRHTPEEYDEFFGVLDAVGAESFDAINDHLPQMIRMANAVQTCFDQADMTVPVGHAFQVLGLLLMQAGTLNLEIAETIVSLPDSAASAPGPDGERVVHEGRFKAAVRQYLAARVVKPVAIPSLDTNVEDGQVKVGLAIQVVLVYRGDAVKYRPLSWGEFVSSPARRDEGAKITEESFGFRFAFASSGVARYRIYQHGEPEMETLAAQAKIDREKHPAIYTRDPDDMPLVGKRVRLTGLVKRPDYNGLLGTVAAYSHTSLRYAVEVDTLGRMALKEANLTAL